MALANSAVVRPLQVFVAELKTAELLVAATYSSLAPTPKMTVALTELLITLLSKPGTRMLYWLRATKLPSSIAKLAGPIISGRAATGFRVNVIGTAVDSAVRMLEVST